MSLHQTSVFSNSFKLFVYLLYFSHGGKFLFDSSDSQEEIPEAVKREYTGSTVVYSQDETMKEGSVSSTSGESITCSDRAVLEDFDDEELACKHHEDVTCMADESKKINFRLEDVCVEGNTLLWDIVQDKNAVSIILFLVIRPLRYLKLFITDLYNTGSRIQ